MKLLTLSFYLDSPSRAAVFSGIISTRVAVYLMIKIACTNLCVVFKDSSQEENDNEYYQ
jgi:hypothetical protein